MDFGGYNMTNYQAKNQPIESGQEEDVDWGRPYMTIRELGGVVGSDVVENCSLDVADDSYN